ncbi:hypothetical protein HUJ04_004529 [Dendroctonus ponderosae]|nr:hypothetical protein HUJ04_004529 [Dendroctonus ponderosae]
MVGRFYPLHNESERISDANKCKLRFFGSCYSYQRSIRRRQDGRWIPHGIQFGLLWAYRFSWISLHVMLVARWAFQFHIVCRSNNMLRFVCLFAIFHGAARAYDHELKCPSSSGSTTPARLRADLLCDYDSYIRPVKNHNNATTVQFRLMLKYFQYDHFSHMLSVDAWMTVIWLDEHLKWQPKDYDGIKSIHLSPNYDIWYPDLSVYNSCRKDQSTDPKVVGDISCSVTYEGTVFCVPPVHFDALCVPNLTKFPYDMQRCEIRMGSWVHKGEEIAIKPMKPVVDTEEMDSNGEWELVNFQGVVHKGNYSCCPNDTYPSVDIVLNIKRNSHTHTINVVVPLIVCILVTVTAMAMSPLNRDRFVLNCVSIIVHIFHIQNLVYSIPTTGEDLPSLLAISRDSSLLAGLAIVFTIVLKNMMQNQCQSPAWVAVSASVLIASRPGQLIFLQDASLKGAAASQKQEDGDTIISNNVETPPSASSSDWYIVAKFLDVLLLASYVLAYVIILFKF